jgi:hypothetical protein
MASFLEYRDNTYHSGLWNQLGIHELVEVRYVDEVYKPAKLSFTVQNASAGGGIAHASVAHDGEDDGTGLVVTNNGHGLSTNDRITITAESTGTVEAKVYVVERINNNDFYIKHYSRNPWTGEKHQGGLVSRVDGNGSVGTLSYVPTGKYSIETIDVANPDFHMGQEVMWWHVPENFNTSGPYTHTGASPLVVAHTAHGFSVDKILQITSESTGVIPDGEYRVSNVPNANSYRLQKIKSEDELNGTGTAGSLSLYFETNTIGYPVFYGTITSLEEAWSQYGKIIKLEAVDHLQYLANTTAKKIMKVLRPAGEAEKMGAADPEVGQKERIAQELPKAIYLAGDPKNDENRFSLAIANIIDDFQDGSAPIYTDNGNKDDAPNSIGTEKFESSGFIMTPDELASGQFSRDISTIGYKVLRVMQDMAMADRHVTTVHSSLGDSGSGGDGTSNWEASSSWNYYVKVTSAHGLSSGQTIAVYDSTTGSGTYIPNSYYLVDVISTTDFYLKTLDNAYLTVPASNASLKWEGAEDGNFGYDYYLDSGMYGLPGGKGYTLAGGATSYNPRPHLNYFKRGYKQFRPDATGLNIILPLASDEAETGQVRIMYPDSSFKIGDDEMISDVELTIVDKNGEQDKDQSALGHNLQILRTKKLQCMNNVDQYSEARTRLDHAGRWLGDFHWNRHDSFTTAQSVHDENVLTGSNDEAMFWASGGSAASPGFTDALQFSDKSDMGTIAGEFTDGFGSVAQKHAVRRVLASGAGGTDRTSKISGGAEAVTGYTGPSGIAPVGRKISTSPSKRATEEEIKRTVNEGTMSEVTTTYRFPKYNTGVVDCDLIKSIKNCEDEGLEEVTTQSATYYDSGGNVRIIHNGPSGSWHNLATGNVIKIMSGDSSIYDDTNYWNNYKRVEIPLPPAWWQPDPRTGFTGSGTGTLNVETTTVNPLSLVLDTGQGAEFPADNFYINVGTETMRCTSRSGDTLTCTREQLDTSASNHPATTVVALNTEAYNIFPTGGNAGSLQSESFYITNLPYEAYEGIIEAGGTIPATSTLPKQTYVTNVSGSYAITYKRIFNAFDGVCRVQYQSNRTRNEEANSDSYVLISDRQRLDAPYMSIDEKVFADTDRESSDGSISGMTSGLASMPDGDQYSADSPAHVVGLLGGQGRHVNQELSQCAVPVRFRIGDKISETRYLMRDGGGPTTASHWFKNTQAIITQSLMEDKKRSKSTSLTYSLKGNDFNEVRRVAASLLTRTSKDLIQGSFSILAYPYIKLTGQAATHTTGSRLYPTQSVRTYGGRAGMLVMKTDSSDGIFEGAVLAEKVDYHDGYIDGTLSSGETWSVGEWYRMYIHLRAGHSIRVSDPRSSVQANMLLTKIEYNETPSSIRSRLSVIGYKDLPTGVPVRPLGNIAKAVVDQKQDVAGPITLAKARLKEITFIAGEE